MTKIVDTISNDQPLSRLRCLKFVIDIIYVLDVNNLIKNHWFHKETYLLRSYPLGSGTKHSMELPVGLEPTSPLYMTTQ